MLVEAFEVGEVEEIENCRTTLGEKKKLLKFAYADLGDGGGEASVW